MRCPIAAFVCLASTCFLASNSFAQSAKEALDLLKQNAERIEAAKNAPKPGIPKIPPGASEAELREIVKKFNAGWGSALDLEWSLAKENARLSLIVYRDAIKNGTDQSAAEVLKSYAYEGQKLTSLADAFDRSKTTGAELLDFVNEALAKGPATRGQLTLRLSDDLRTEIGRSFVRTGASQTKFDELFGNLDTLATETAKWYMNKYHDSAIESAFSAMLEEAGKTPGLEARIVSYIEIAYAKAGSVSARKAILAALAGSKEPAAYALIKRQFETQDAEIRQAALLRWWQVRQPQVADDLIALIARAENGSLKLDHDWTMSIYNLTGRLLDRGAESYEGRTPEDRVAAEKAKAAVIASLNSPNTWIKANLPIFFKEKIFTDAEVDKYILSIAQDPRASNHWNATEIVARRKLSTPNALKAMQALLNDPDVSVAAEARAQASRILGGARLLGAACKTAL